MEPLHCSTLFSLKIWRFQISYHNSVAKEPGFGIMVGILISPNFEGEKRRTVEGFEL